MTASHALSQLSYSPGASPAFSHRAAERVNDGATLRTHARKRTGPGGPRGLQNRCRAAPPSEVGSTPIRFRQGAPVSIALAAHGGAWNIPDDQVEASRLGLSGPLHAGYAALSRGASALDVVELVVRGLEDDPAFNAGRGSHLNSAVKTQ